MLFATCKVKLHADESVVSPYESTGDRRYLFCIWHDQLVMTLFSGRPKNMAGLVSRHQDGSFLADGMKMIGIASVRGSTSRGGAQAMRELMETARDLHVAITPDGPRGPRHVIKQGIVFLASHSGRAIIPGAFSCHRCWKFSGGWSDLMIPKPFTTIYIRGGAPFHVPSRLKRDGLDEYTAKLQAVMERLEVEVEALARGEELPTADIEQSVAA